MANETLNHTSNSPDTTSIATDGAQDWQTKWDAECPLAIGVAFTGWESGSDAALRDELKRIRDTGFGMVRVRFDRNGDIERSPGMMNWRNPDRLFDSAAKAGLRVIAAPGNQIPRTSGPVPPATRPISEEDVNYALAWIRRFVKQYRDHATLFAWAVETDAQANVETSEETRAYHERLLNAFHTADPGHPVLPITVLPTTGTNANALLPLIAVPHTRTTMRPDALPPALTLEWERPAYAQMRMAADLRGPEQPLFSDCCGGTSRYSGDRAFTMSEGAMTRLLLLQLAAGMRGITLSAWKPTRRGSGVGESGLLDWLDRVTPHAQAAGRIAQAAEKHRQELWHSVTTPHVHILCAPQNGAFAQSRAEKENGLKSDGFAGNEPTLTRLGAARALLNANVPFAFLSEEQLLSDATPPAPVLFLPGVEMLSETLLMKLKEIAANGGRIVADMPTGYVNERGELLDTRPGSAWEQLFGASVAGLFCFSNPNVKEWEPSRGQQRAMLVPTTAKAAGGEPETPAFTENRVGKGRAVLVNLSLSRLNAAPNLQNAQLSLLSYLLGSKQTELPGLSGCLTFRRTGEQAEHVFLVNDSSKERTVNLSLAAPFTQVGDALADTPLTVENSNVTVTVPAGSGRWLRLSTQQD